MASLGRDSGMKSKCKRRAPGIQEAVSASVRDTYGMSCLYPSFLSRWVGAPGTRTVGVAMILTLKYFHSVYRLQLQILLLDDSSGNLLFTAQSRSPCSANSLSYRNKFIERF